jgi:hypothetical protein
VAVGGGAGVGFVLLGEMADSSFRTASASSLKLPGTMGDPAETSAVAAAGTAPVFGVAVIP